jgi:ribosome-associated protein
MIRVTPAISISESDLHFDYIRASGPGGQNVNKVATAAQLRFDVRGCASLPVDVQDRLLKLAGGKATADGTIVITARRFRAREKNRQDAISRLVDLLRRAATSPKRRRRTRPTAESRRRRLEEKRRRSRTKEGRRAVPYEED